MNIKNLLIILSLMIVYSCSETPSRPWEANWIGLKNEDPNSWICFRKTINIKDNPENAIAKIACDSKYWLWINGDLAVFEGQLKRGPTPEDTYYDSVDLSQFLKKGENSIAVLVWYFGKHGFSHNSSGKSALIFDAEVNGRRFVSDSTWKVRLHPAYENTGEPHPNYRLPERNTRFNAMNDIPGWTKPEFDDTGWINAKEFGVPPVSPWNNLVLRPILQWKNSGLVSCQELKSVITDNNERIFMCKLPANIQVTPYLKVDAPAGIKIEIKTDNYMGGNSPNLRTEYITREGTQEFESLSWINGHEMHYSIPEEVKVLELKYRETGYNAEFTGDFSCDDDQLNILYDKAVRTLYVTMRDNYMDCPDRERAQWWGDAVNEIGEAFYVFDAENGPKLAKKAMYELMLWQREDSTIYSPVPSGRVVDVEDFKKNPQAGYYDRELPRQMLASVGWYGFWYYYLYSGDKQTIVDLYPRVKKYLDVWKIGSDGLVVHRPGGWDWTDWGDNKDVPVIENAFYYLALKAGAEMAQLSGKSGDIHLFQEKMKSIEEHFNEAFWTGDKYHSVDYEGETDDRANAMAVVAGLAKKEYYPAIREVLKTQFHASPYMEKYVGEALYLMNAPEQAVERIKTRYKQQIESEITTLWEGWELGTRGWTYNHAWSGGPLTLLCQYAAGVAPVKPGFEEFSVLPQMGPLKNISLTVPVPGGKIDLKLNNSSSHFSMNIDVPDGKTAKLGIPENKLFPVNRIRANGKVIWEKDTDTEPIQGMSFMNKDGSFIYLKADAGQWDIKAD
jgi:alpha-L-rhamnosidase